VAAAPTAATMPVGSLAPTMPVAALTSAGTVSAGRVAAGQVSRRTVVITGHGHDHSGSRRGYEARLKPHERSSFKPDRAALWAVLLGLALLLGAVTSSHAATLHAGLLQPGGLHAATVHAAGRSTAALH
jgi:hypothetical protein